MKKDLDAPKTPRKPRSDGQKNRELLIQVAKEAFTASGPGASLDDIAKKANVGAGTLYRHFPSREALLEAVYVDDVTHLAEAAERLGRELAPMEALRAWLLLFIEHLATKRVIAAALTGLVEGHSMFERNVPRLHAPVRELYDRAIQAGELRPDINPQDHLRAIVGASLFGSSDDWRSGAQRLMEILLLGSRP